MIIMESIFRTSMEELPLLKHGRSRSINAENPHGEKGKGAMSASVLGAARKGSPCLKNLAPGSTTLLADIAGAGVIRHIWFTVDSRTSDADRFVLRDLVLKMYWDGEEMPSVEETFLAADLERIILSIQLPLWWHLQEGLTAISRCLLRRKHV